jgi:hypothetical protein
MCPCRFEKEIKFYPVHSHVFELENELRLCSWMGQGKQMIRTAWKPVMSKLQSRGLVNPLYCQRNP